MSRNITSSPHSYTEKDRALQNTNGGKLLFTEVRNRQCALLLQNDRLTAARVISGEHSKVGAVYLGKVKNVVKNIDACFVEIADREICFLSLKDAKGAWLVNRIADGRILEGDELLVQVTRDAQKTKQASVTAQISLSDEIFAFSLGRPGIGYSNKLSRKSKMELQQLVAEQDFLASLSAISPKECPVGMVLRTKAGDLSREQIIDSFRSMSTDWVNLFRKASHSTCFSCMKEAASPLHTVIQQLALPSEFSEILTDDSALFEQLQKYASAQLFKKPVRFYEDETFPLKKLYSLETKIDTALNTCIWLKSGGYLIIEPTEAMTVIDVNSGKYEGKKDNEEAVFKINCEAAEEIALQLRLRNLSGIIVVDFINMKSAEGQERLLKQLRRLVLADRQKTTVVDMTPLGLVEITRKKEYRTLQEQFSSFS